MTTQMTAEIRIQSTDELLKQARELASKIHIAHMDGDFVGVEALTGVMKLLAIRAARVAELEQYEYDCACGSRTVIDDFVEGKPHTAGEVLTELASFVVSRYGLQQRSYDNLIAIRRLESIAIATMGGK